MLENKILYESLKMLVIKALPFFEEAMLSKSAKRHLYQYPKLSYNENGFPSVSNDRYKIDIASFCSYNPDEEPGPLVPLEDFKEFSIAATALYEDPLAELYNYCDLFTPESNYYQSYSHCEFMVKWLVARYYSQHGTKFEEEKFNEIYLPIATFYSVDTLWFDVSVPLLFVQFQTDDFEIAPGIILRKISDEAHKSRHRIIRYDTPIQEPVFMSATHELVLKNYSCKKVDGPFSFDKILSSPETYPRQPIERFITLLKIVTDQTSGYAQFIVYPQNWANYYSADLIYLAGTSIRRYPSEFDSFYWNKTAYPQIDLAQLSEIATLYNKLHSQKENKLEFALKRFYKSIMRQDEEDIIVDLIIALEMLLGDSEKNEITHKLALRIAALLSHYGNERFDAIEVFKNVKQIYAYRSSIVHGSHGVQKKREIKLKEEISVPAVDLAKNYLCEILKIVITNPKHLIASENDNLLLLSK